MYASSGTKSAEDVYIFSKLRQAAGAPSRQVGRPLGGASTARPLEACERLMSGFLQRHGPLPRHARTLKTTWCAWQWRPPLPSALPRGRPVASERAAWWCCWWQILRPDRRLRPPALSSLPYRPRVIRHVRPLTEGVGEWRVATLQHTLSRERETLLSVSVLHALKTCVSARNVASEGDPDSGPERPLGAWPTAWPTGTAWRSCGTASTFRKKTKLSCGEAVAQLLRYRHRLVRTGGRLRTAGAPPSPTFPYVHASFSLAAPDVST